MKKTKVYISYAGGNLESVDSVEKNREEFANHIQAEFEKYNFEVIRDKSNLGYRESINEFTNYITNGEYIITIVSQKYLAESRYCQEEIREIIHKQKNYYPILTLDAENVTESNEKHKYIEKAQIFIDDYAEKHFKGEEKVKFLECKRTVKEFITDLNDKIFLKQSEVDKLILKVRNDNNERVKKINKDLQFHELNHKVFEYASILEKFDLFLPLTLYQKLNQIEWDLLENYLRSDESKLNSDDDSIGVTLEGSFLEHDKQYLKLNNSGKNKSLTSESQDELIYQILINCDSDIEQEYELFKALTLKEKYIEVIFKDFSLSIESLIQDSNKFYPQNNKQTLLYRLLAIHYSKKGNEALMRKAFQKCIDLLKDNKENELSSFFLGWAQREKGNDNYDKSFEIYNQVLTIFREKRVNTVARFNLAIHYYKLENKTKALSFLLEKFDNKFIFKTEGFWEKFSDTTFFYIKRGFTEDAKCLKSSFVDLAKYFNDRKLYNLASYVHNKIKNSIEQNVNFKKDLVNSFLNVDLEKNIIKSYLKSSDITKAREILDELKNSSISPLEYQGLLIDLSYAEGNIENAIFKGKKFIEENPNLNAQSIYIRIANIYFNHKKIGFRRYQKSIFYYEKINSIFLDKNYMYATSLMHTRNEKKAIKIFRAFFTAKNENNKFAISNYITCCIRLKKYNEAREFIIKKILDRRKEEYSNSFISFLQQQRLKLTYDKSYSDSILKEALKYSDSPELKAIVYNRYAEHLVSSVKFQHNNFNKPFNYNENEIEEAIINFKKSNDLVGDDRKLLSISECYFFIDDYDSSFSFLNKITNRYQIEKKELLKLQIYFKGREFKKIEEYLNNNSRKVQVFTLLCLGKKFKESYSKRKEYLSKAVSLDKTYYSKLQQAIVLYSINQKRKGLDIVSELLESNKYKKNEIKEEFENNISRFKPRLGKEIIEVIQKDLRKLTTKNDNLANKINDLILDFPFNEKLLDFKFQYYFKLKKYEECESTLNTIIDKKLFYNRTAHLFYELANIYYIKSNSYNHHNPSKTDVVKNYKFIEKSDYYISFAIDSFYSKFKIKRLTAMIAYKKGDFKTYNSIINNLKKNLTDNQNISLTKYLDVEIKRIKIFLWNQIENNYYSKVQFYKFQVNTVVATIIGNKDQKDKSQAIKILTTISSDTAFNKENNYNLLTSINTRFAHYYYHIKRNYTLALKYQEKIWKKKIYDLNFIGAFLRCITNCKDFDFGIKCCETIIERNNSALSSRFYGNFLKERNRHKEALDSYNVAFELACNIKEINIEETERKQREKVHILNNIAMLVVKSIKDKDFFMDNIELKKIGFDCIHKIHNLDPTFNFIKPEYVENTTKQLNLLK